jgi:copper(I)-binding protein
MTLRNPSTAPLILVGADSPDYDSVMLHQSIRNGATAKMKMADALLLPPAQTVLFEPGGYHFMLSAVRHPIVPGATVTLRLRFADGRTQSVAMPVSPATRTK